MQNSLRLELTDELAEFVAANCGEGTLYATANDFVCEVLRQRKLVVEAAELRESIIAGYSDMIAGRVYDYDGNLREMLEAARIPRAEDDRT